VSTIFFDVDTQLDFMLPSGALYVPGAEHLTGTLAALTHHANTRGIKILSSADAHAEDDTEFKQWPPHCVAGTQGQQKISATLLPKPLVLSSERGALEGVATRVADAGQIIIEKQTLDVFSNTNLRPLLEGLKPQRVVVYGVVSELCVECAAFGLLRLGHRVELVTDAIKSLHPEQEKQMLQRFESQGGLLTTSAAVLAQSAAA
jgi:nicotinamidase/pyrazinamidase